MGRVTIIGVDERQERELLSHNTIGRHPSNTLQILDRIVSKEHCHIDLVSGQYVLRDLGSLNGTYVNGERVQEHPLDDGDEITMGQPGATIFGRRQAKPGFADQTVMRNPRPFHVRSRHGRNADADRGEHAGRILGSKVPLASPRSELDVLRSFVQRRQILTTEPRDRHAASPTEQAAVPDLPAAISHRRPAHLKPR